MTRFSVSSDVGLCSSVSCLPIPLWVGHNPRTVCAHTLPSRASSWWKRFQLYLSSREPCATDNWGAFARVWANGEWAILCGAYLLVAACLPSTGWSFRICLFHQALGVDCPGCGMTRAISNLWRGDFWMALRYHPFSPLAFVLLLFQASSIAFPLDWRIRVVETLNRRNQILWRLAVSLGVAFFLFGFARAATQLSGLLLR